MSEQFTGGQLVVKVMEEFGAKVVFGVPGGQTLYVTDPIQDVPGMRFVHTRHENGAATAADGWGRLTGEPGICLATTGPGATNLITGLGGALRDSSRSSRWSSRTGLPTRAGATRRRATTSCSSAASAKNTSPSATSPYCPGRCAKPTAPPRPAARPGGGGPLPRRHREPKGPLRPGRPGRLLRAPRQRRERRSH